MADTCVECQREAMSLHQQEKYSPHATHLALTMKSIVQGLKPHVRAAIGVKRKRKEEEVEDVPMTDAENVTMEEFDPLGIEHEEEDRPSKREAEATRHFIDLSSGMLMETIMTMLDHIDSIGDDMDPLQPMNHPSLQEIETMLTAEIRENMDLYYLETMQRPGLLYKRLTEELNKPVEMQDQERLARLQHEGEMAQWTAETVGPLIQSALEGDLSELEGVKRARQWFWWQLTDRLFGPDRAPIPDYLPDPRQLDQPSNPIGWRHFFVELWQKSGRATPLILVGEESVDTSLLDELGRRFGIRALFHEHVALLRMRPWFVSPRGIYKIVAAADMVSMIGPMREERAEQHTSNVRIQHLRRHPYFDKLFSVVTVDEQNEVVQDFGAFVFDYTFDNTDPSIGFRAWTEDGRLPLFPPTSDVLLNVNRNTIPWPGIFYAKGRGIVNEPGHFIEPMAQWSDAHMNNGRLIILHGQNHVLRIGRGQDLVHSSLVLPERMVSIAHYDAGHVTTTIAEDGSIYLFRMKVPRVQVGDNWFDLSAEKITADLPIQEMDPNAVASDPEDRIVWWTSNMPLPREKPSKGYHFRVPYQHFVKCRWFKGGFLYLSKEGTLWFLGKNLFHLSEYYQHHLSQQWTVEDGNVIVFADGERVQIHPDTMKHPRMQAMLNDLRFTMRPYKLLLHGDAFYRTVDWEPPRFIPSLAWALTL